MWKLKNIHWEFSVYGKFYICNLDNKKEQEHVVSHMWLPQINQYTLNWIFNIQYLQWAIYNSKSISET